MAIEIVAEAFQIDVYAVQIRFYLIYCLGGHVTVRDEDVGQALLVGKFGRVIGQLEVDCGLSVGMGNAAAFVVQGGFDQLLWRIIMPVDALGEPDFLADLPVLAELAAEIAAGRSIGKTARAGVEVKQGLFLDGVHINRADSRVIQTVELPLDILTDQAVAPLAGFDTAAEVAKAALDLSVQERLPKHGRMSGRISHYRKYSLDKRLLPRGKEAEGPRADLIIGEKIVDLVKVYSFLAAGLRVTREVKWNICIWP